jgi:hypothetical protein
MSGRRQVALALVVAAILSSSGALARRTHEREDRREVQGRALFGKGDYPAALEIYATLFAERNDPVFLRNIGRCYQMMEEPDKAIGAFREYLRRAHVKPAERSEVEGFIVEMQDLKKQREATAPPPTKVPPVAARESPPTAEPANATVIAVPVAVQPVSRSAPGATLAQESAGSEATPSSEGSLTGRWWFWTGLVVVLAGGAAAALLLTRPHGGIKPACLPAGTECSN